MEAALEEAYLPQGVHAGQRLFFHSPELRMVLTFERAIEKEWKNM